MPIWLSSRPTARPEAKWSPEEDEKLLEMEKKYNKRWSDIPDLSHTPFECEVRYFQLRQQQMRKRQKLNDPQPSSDPAKEVVATSESSNAACESMSKPKMETLRVKDEELQNLARELRAQVSTIMELAEKLSETAQAAEAMDDQRRVAFAEKEQLKQSFEKLLESTAAKLRECEEKVVELSKEKDQLAKQRDSAIQEAHLWRTELGKARDRVVILEAAVVRAEEKTKFAEVDAEAKIKEAVQRESATLLEKEDLKIYVDALQAKILRQQQMETKEVCEKTESPSDMSDTRSLTKHVDSSDENVDKPCLSISKSVSITEDDDLHISEGSQGIVHPTDDNQWNDIQATESTISDVREVATDDRPA